MKNFLLTYFLILLLVPPAIFAQEDPNKPIDSKTEKADITPNEDKPKDPVVDKVDKNEELRLLEGTQSISVLHIHIFESTALRIFKSVPDIALDPCITPE